MKSKLERLQEEKLIKENTLLDESIKNERQKRLWENLKIGISAASIIISAIIISISLNYAIQPTVENQIAEATRKLDKEKSQFELEKTTLLSERERLTEIERNLDLREKVVLAEEAEHNLRMIFEKRDSLSLVVAALQNKTAALKTSNYQLSKDLKENRLKIRYSLIDYHLNNLSSQRISDKLVEDFLYILYQKDDYSEYLITRLKSLLKNDPSSTLKIECCYFLAQSSDRKVYKEFLLQEFPGLINELAAQVELCMSDEFIYKIMADQSLWNKADIQRLIRENVHYSLTPFANFKNQIYLTELFMNTCTAHGYALWRDNPEAYIQILKLNNTIIDYGFDWTIDELNLFCPQLLIAQWMVINQKICEPSTIDQQEQGLMLMYTIIKTPGFENNQVLISLDTRELSLNYSDDFWSESRAEERASVSCEITDKIYNVWFVEIMQWSRNAELDFFNQNPSELIRRIENQSL